MMVAIHLMIFMYESFIIRIVGHSFGINGIPYVLFYTQDNMCAKIHDDSFSNYGVKTEQTIKLTFALIILVWIQDVCSM